ncbi:hypothetical protein [Motilibacter aurantiacus]|uniref:hypothetical protein n=1 Tax=Motilibacter aurantiacus TaxID=2714955 RepID=UPI00140BD848|nr:hypothetical protein [Motilibacter aurantiacus]NHC46829.1 hypothetical protein [Motilibacter aurantiacus]
MAGGSADADGTWPEQPGSRPREEPDGLLGSGREDARADAGPRADAASRTDGWEGWSLELPAGLVVPDDASALDKDRLEWLREQHRARSRRRWLAGAPGARRPTLLLLLVIAALVSSLSTVTVMLAPRPAQRQLPIAASTVADGQVGGLLPDIRLETPVRMVEARAIRPAVLVVLPTDGCTCEGLVRETARRAGAAAGIATWVVLPARTDAGEELAATARRSGGMAAVDRDAVIARSLAAAGPTLALVHADGVIDTVEQVDGASDAEVGAWLERHVGTLHRAGGAATTSAAAAAGS